MDDKTIDITIPAEQVEALENREIYYLLDSCSDVGICKKVNQDAYCVRIFKTQEHTIVLAAVCDGVGGLSEGEYASNDTIHSLNNWFDYRLNKLVVEEKPEDLFQILIDDIKQLIHEQNETIFEYGKQNNIRIGTTLTAMLFVDHNYCIAQIGDSRAYLMKDELIQLTEDQSLVAREVKEGRLTEEEARHDKRRNIILQCLGADEVVFPVIQTGLVQPGSSYFICSDGFVHELKKAEIEKLMNPNVINDRIETHERMIRGIQMVKERGEKDNITVVLVRTI